MLVSVVVVATLGATFGSIPAQAQTDTCTYGDIEVLTPEWTESFTMEDTVYFSWETFNIGTSVETHISAWNASAVLYGDVMEWQVDVSEIDPTDPKVPVDIEIIGEYGCRYTNWVIYVVD